MAVSGGITVPELKSPISNSRTRRFFAPILGALCTAAIAFLAGCGGGGSAPPAPTPVATPTPTPVPTPAPQVSSISPTSVPVGSGAFTLSVTGSNFLSSSVVQWNGSPRATTFSSSTLLQASITAADVATAENVAITVVTPGVGSGLATGPTFTVVGTPAPILNSFLPTSAFVNGPAFTLDLFGANFTISSSVLWNSTNRPTTFLSTTHLQASIPVTDLASVGTAAVSISTPGPGGGTSAQGQFSISANPLPTTFSITPTTAQQGDAALTLTVNGSNFVNASVVQWNGSARPTTFVSSSQLTAQIAATDLATFGNQTITVSNPAPGGGVSGNLTFGITFPVTTINQLANTMVYDPLQKVIYLSVPGTAAANPNTVSILDPVNGTITGSVSAGSNPNVMAISGDSTLLYVGIDGSSSVQRFTLPTLASDISFALGSNIFGPMTALDIQVAPGAPHTTALTLASPGVSPSADFGVEIMDDSTARATIAKGFGPGGGGGVLYDSLQWGSDATVLYAGNNEDTGFDFYRLTVDATGITLAQDAAGLLPGFSGRIHFDGVTGLVYGDDGQAINPGNGTPAGTFNISGLGQMVPDGANHAAYFLAQNFAGTVTVELRKYNLTTFTLSTTIPLPPITGNIRRFIRWGTSGLAFNTDAGHIYILNNIP